MRRYLLAAVAAAAIATPALARDGSPYVGIEAGIMIPSDISFDYAVRSPANNNTYREAFALNMKKSLDADAIAGYDFGMFRLEGELGYKRLRSTNARITGVPVNYNAFSTNGNRFDISSRGSILSLMANAMLDFEDGPWGGSVGVGAGRARVKFLGDRDSAFALQGIAGVRYAITPNVDVGLKYRYFRTGRVNFDNSFTNAAVGAFGVGLSDKLRTHSLLASLTYNFYAPPPPPVIVEPVAPPPPPPPATQTCFDGSVILATDVCPQPPVETPPPPPAPVPERG